jgi:hypothetical protein
MLHVVWSCYYRLGYFIPDKVNIGQVRTCQSRLGYASPV